MTHSYGPAGKIANYFVNSKLTPLFIVASMILGLASVIALPREEEPQIIVPMIDIFVQMPGSDATEVEQRVTRPMEKLLWEIPGVEYIYSTSMPGMAMTIVRFLVGQDEEQSIVRLQSKLAANMDRIPCCITPPLIKPRFIDDVPILALTFWSDEVEPYLLRRVAAEVEDQAKREPNVSLTSLIGGDGRRVTVELDPARMAGFGLDPVAVSRIVFSANQAADAGSFPSTNEGQIVVHTGSFLKTAEDVRNVVVSAYMGRPVYLRDVATIVDGPPQPENYVYFGAGPAAEEKGITHEEAGKGPYPAVTLTLAKRKGTNAISVAKKVLARVERLKGTIIPDNAHMTITRHYGETAEEKSNELLWHMLIAVVSVTVLIWFTLGHRESGVVAFAIPVTLALTMGVFYLYGYTLNRITLFALIFSIGILVDDAIVVVENIVRHFRLPGNKDRPRLTVAVEAVDEVGNPTILATLTVIAAILPMAFVGGLMGPYMRPIPVGASAAMVFSILVAFIVTPWASLHLLRKDDKHEGHETEDWATRLYRNVMDHLLHVPKWRWSFMIGVALLLLGAMAMVGVGLVKVKMLPFDNKSEFQVIIDMPETATLEETAAAAFDMGDYLSTVNEVVDYQVHVGTSGPFNFNGLVRHYYLRKSPNQADIQVNLAAKGMRAEQSHAIAKRVRGPLEAIAKRYDARVKIAEVPPGPPVVSTLVAEVYGPDYERQRELALKIRDLFEKTDGVVDVDWFMEDEHTRYQIDVDQEKAALHGISVAQINETLRIALSGTPAGLLHQELEKENVPIVLQPPLAQRAGLEMLKGISVRDAAGHMISLSDLVAVRKTKADRAIYHKNLMPVVYVAADVAGAKESPVYAILELRKKIDEIVMPEGYNIRQYTANLPESDQRFSMKWDGEWHITYEVFRDLGLAFAVVLVLIFVLVVGWFQSFSTPVTIMMAIPFSLIGILPAHWAMGAFFTATSMIGFIAGAGIVVRNSIILVDFIELRLAEGAPLDQAVIDAGAVRFRPMMLTAAAVVVGASVILFDPIFQGLAISLMAGEVASLLFSRMTVPILYFLDKRWEFAHERGHEKK